MSVRPATYEDLLPASKVLAAAFKDEALFGGHFHPYRNEFPDDMHLFFLQKLRLDWVRTSSPQDLQILLSHPSNDPSNIAGVAIWSRKRATPSPDSPSVVAKVKEMEALNAAEAAQTPNRAAEVKNQGILAAAEADQSAAGGSDGSTGESDDDVVDAEIIDEDEQNDGSGHSGTEDDAK